MTKDSMETALAADERRYQALFSNDYDALDAMLALDYLHVHATGKIDDKAQFIGTLKAGAYRFVSAERSDQRVRRLGSATLLSGKVATTVIAGGVSKTIRNAFLTVWNSEGAEWQLVHWQATKLPET